MEVLAGLLRNVCRTKENITSRNVKSKFYCGYFCCVCHQVTHVQPPHVLCIYLYCLVHISAQKGHIFVSLIFLCTIWCLFAVIRTLCRRFACPSEIVVIFIAPLWCNARKVQQSPSYMAVKMYFILAIKGFPSLHYTVYLLHSLVLVYLNVLWFINSDCRNRVVGMQCMFALLGRYITISRSSSKK